ncbi:hypothetical protein LINPERPRIM_LOCUS23104 [Linum perenne]
MDVLCETEGGLGGIYAGGDHKLEDDVFYDELAKQVLFIIADDDDSSVISRRRDDGCFDLVSHPPAGRTVYNGWMRNDGGAAVRTWPVMTMWSDSGRSGGTGVFIPQTGKSRRRNGSGRRGGANRRQQAQKTVQN